ncbi:MAG: Gfo/Idh/MocA family oxidoreductase [Verrucomicrobiae bacterium]|nr:Gfo/Idh/MocA family oxidoreductase [Verrucomicrobiae bacterium]
MQPVRIAVIGVGSMGSTHANALAQGKIQRATLSAVCDTDSNRFSQWPQIPGFTNPHDLLRAKIADAVVIATPHFDHPVSGRLALEAGLHVLVEKPIAVHKADAQKLLAAHANPQQVFAIMFNQRTDPFYRKIRELVQTGELGAIQRIQWTITTWYRCNAYYRSGTWRATWRGEGGGVLLNQCPHNLDLFQWMFGMPARVRAFCRLGRYHPIEVEDDVTAYMEYANGATATFITSTGEAPGTNRLEVAADHGRLVYENDKLAFQRTEMPVSQFTQTATSMFAAPQTTTTEFTFQDHGGQHNEILQNFVDAILDGKPLIAPASEGIKSLELGNAMLLSAMENRTVELPLDAAAYQRLLEDLIRKSTK